MITTKQSPDLVSRIEAHFAALAQIGNLGPSRADGFCRAGWSREEQAACDYIRTQGEALGLRARWDAVGNLFLTTDPEASGVIQVGSHLDTVPSGGLYDGAAGVVAGLEALRLARREGAALELVVWRGEESATYGTACKGSLAHYGRLAPESLASRHQGSTLRHAIEDLGFSTAPILTGRALGTRRVLGYFEAHIEQGARLEIEQVPLGIVTGVRGAERLRVVVRGAAAHSGATPMGLPYRRDANLTVAHLLVALDGLQESFRGTGTDLVQTVGVLNSDADYNQIHPEVQRNALTRVSDYAYFYLDFRSIDPGVLRLYGDLVRGCAEAVAARFGTSCEIERLGSAAALPSLDAGLQDTLEVACAAAGYPCLRLPSGAYHDAAVVAAHAPSALLFIPCRGGISHDPAEFTTCEAVARAAEVLAEGLRMVAKDGC